MYDNYYFTCNLKYENKYVKLIIFLVSIKQPLITFATKPNFGPPKSLEFFLLANRHVGLFAVSLSKQNIIKKQFAVNSTIRRDGLNNQKAFRDPQTNENASRIVIFPIRESSVSPRTTHDTAMETSGNTQQINLNFRQKKYQEEGRTSSGVCRALHLGKI